MRNMKAFVILCAMLAAMAGCGGQQSGRLDPIAPSAARAIALAAAGLTADQVEFSGTELDARDGLDYYQVGFTAGGQTYRYDIDAMTGTVIDSQTDGDVPLADAPAPAAQAPVDGSDPVSSPEPEPSVSPSQTPEPSPAPSQTPEPSPVPSQTPSGGDGLISEEEARAAALGHAGLTANQVTFIRSNLDWDDGRRHYDVEFYTVDGNTVREYDYEIDAQTGAILDVDYDAEYYQHTTHHAEHGESTHHTDHHAAVTADQAKQIALAQVPGATLSDMREFETDYDDGRVVYEGTIYYGEMEYEFEIDGYSGAIRDWDVESIYD